MKNAALKNTALKTMVAAISIACATLLASVPPATAAGVPEPALIVKVASVDGRPKVKVARQLKVLVSCSNDCSAVARLTLKTPTNTLRVGGSNRLPAAAIWTTGIRLTDYGLGYLKQSYRRSVLKVVVTAVDRETRKKVVRTRHFRFYR
jgi:hypothetical protein